MPPRENPLQVTAIRFRVANMSEEQFMQELRDYTQRKPFVPFIVELTDGERVFIDQPAVAFSGGTAGFINEIGELVGFSHDKVRAISSAATQKTT